MIFCSLPTVATKKLIPLLSTYPMVIIPDAVDEDGGELIDSHYLTLSYSTESDTRGAWRGSRMQLVILKAQT